MKRIAIFASGEGSNAEAIVKYFSSHKEMEVVVLLSNRSMAKVHQRMELLGVPSITFDKQQWNEATEIVDFLRAKKIDLIVLAGFLSIIQPPIIDAYYGKIVNIHPSLLPKYGGAGMWGMNVHNAVIANKEKKSGITIHYVNEKVDGGAIIAQYECDVLPNETPDSLASKVHRLEYKYYPMEIEKLLM